MQEYNKAVRTAKSTEKILNSRGWMVGYTRPFEVAEQEIKRIRLEAVQTVLARFEASFAEAKLWADEDCADYGGSLNKRELRSAKVDVKIFVEKISALKTQAFLLEIS